MSTVIFPKIDKTTWFYKNCKRQRAAGAKICQCCPFRAGIEEQEFISNRECKSFDSPDGQHHASACSSDPIEGYCCEYCGEQIFFAEHE